MKRWIHASSSASQAIDTTTTGTSYYNDFLNESDAAYMKKNKNRIGNIVMMSPEEYFKTCAEKVFTGTSVSSLIYQRRRDDDSLDNLKSMLDEGKKFWLPYINIPDSGQEGLHRMLVLGDTFGWDTKFPVLLVESANPRLDDVREAFRELNRAVGESKDYMYVESRLPEDFVAQVQWELERYDEDTPFVAKLKSSDDYKFVVTLEGFESEIKIEIPYDNLRLKDEDDDDFEIDDDDLDIEDLDIADFFFK